MLRTEHLAKRRDTEAKWSKALLIGKYRETMDTDSVSV